VTQRNEGCLEALDRRELRLTHMILEFGKKLLIDFSQDTLKKNFFGLKVVMKHPKIDLGVFCDLTNDEPGASALRKKFASSLNQLFIRFM